MTIQNTRRNFLKTMSLGIGSGMLATSIPVSDFAQEMVQRKDKKKWGVALVGLGSYAKNQLAVGLSQADNCYLAGIVTGSPEKAAEWSKKYNIPSGNIYNYQNFDQIAGNKDIDITHINRHVIFLKIIISQCASAAYINILKIITKDIF